MAKLKKNQSCLLSVHMLKMVLDIFISTFLVSHILSSTSSTVEEILGKGIFNIGLFYFSWYFVYGILDLVSSYFVDKSNRVVFLRLGIIVNMLLIIALVFFGEKISQWVILAGAICGISDAFYYSSYLIMKNELNVPGTFKKFNLYATIYTNLIKIVVPIIMGYLIDASTISAIAIYIVIISAIQLIISFFIECKKPENSKFEIKAYLKYLKTNKDDFDKIKYSYQNSFIAGFKTTYSSLVVILTVFIFSNDFILGLCTSIFSLVTMLGLILYKKVDNKPKVNKFAIYMAIGVIPLITCIVVIFCMNMITLIIFNFTLTIANYFSDYLGSVERDAIIKNLNQNDYIAEHQFLMEAIQVVGRLIAFGLFIVVGLIADPNFIVFKILLFLILLTNPFKFLVMYKQRQIRKDFEKIKNEN